MSEIKTCADCPARYVCANDREWTVTLNDEDCNEARNAIIEFAKQPEEG